MLLRSLMCILLFFYIASPAISEDASPDIPLYHPVYPLLDRLNARDWVAVPDTRPLTRIQVVRMLPPNCLQGFMVRTRGDATR
ncbi:MAG: hypothetical protein OXI23_09790, partial [Gemmatimonadota bacterium]|nr:hypothetical protein [Gemmatimonadota bacterium]